MARRGAALALALALHQRAVTAELACSPAAGTEPRDDLDLALLQVSSESTGALLEELHRLRRENRQLREDAEAYRLEIARLTEKETRHVRAQRGPEPQVSLLQTRSVEPPPDARPHSCSKPLEDVPPYLEDFSYVPFTNVANLEVVPGKNRWGIPMANSTLDVNGKTLTFDDIIYGYDLMFENLGLFTHTSWFGVALQQDPSDAFQLSSLLWREQPDLLIEIGTNTGGGAIFYASTMREYNPDSLVLTIDINDLSSDWYQKTDTNAPKRPMGCAHCKDVRCTSIWNSKHVRFLKGASSSPEVIAEVERIVPRFKKVVVMLDGSHNYEYVLKDLHAYDKFVPVGSYMVVQDTKMTRMYSHWPPYDRFPLRATEDFLSGQGQGRYVVDKQYEYLLYSQHHNGWLRKVSL